MWFPQLQKWECWVPQICTKNDGYANYQWNIFSELMPLPLWTDFKLAFLKDLNGKQGG